MQAQQAAVQAESARQEAEARLQGQLEQMRGELSQAQGRARDLDADAQLLRTSAATADSLQQQCSSLTRYAGGLRLLCLQSALAMRCGAATECAC